VVTISTHVLRLMVSDAAHGVDNLKIGGHQHDNYQDDSDRCDQKRGIGTDLDGLCFQIPIDHKGLSEMIPMFIAAKSKSFGLRRRVCVDFCIRVTDTWVVSGDIINIWDSQNKYIDLLA